MPTFSFFSGDFKVATPGPAEASTVAAAAAFVVAAAAFTAATVFAVADAVVFLLCALRTEAQMSAMRVAAAFVAG